MTPHSPSARSARRPTDHAGSAQTPNRFVVTLILVATAIGFEAPANALTAFKMTELTSGPAPGRDNAPPDQPNGRSPWLLAFLGFTGTPNANQHHPGMPVPNRRTERLRIVLRTLRRLGTKFDAIAWREICYLVDNPALFPEEFLHGGSTPREQGRFDAVRYRSNAAAYRLEDLAIPQDSLFNLTELSEVILPLSADIPSEMKLRKILSGVVDCARGQFVSTSTSSRRVAKHHIEKSLELERARRAHQIHLFTKRHGPLGPSASSSLAIGEREILQSYLRWASASSSILKDLSEMDLDVDVSALLGAMTLPQLALDEALKDRTDSSCMMLVAMSVLQLYPELEDAV